CRGCDYGRPPVRWATLWSGWGEPQAGLGSFDFFLPLGTLYSLPQRCGWAVQLAWDGGARIDLLSQGMLHVGGMFGPAVPPDTALALATSGGVLILMSDGTTITT
ncbi:MAG TPA: hypothetical protein VNG33_16815, partial [Polyangiaceae bacterium]|nr:hypothetical protein [Polyangiaceae bacterium]